MSENLSHIEREVERQLAELGVALSVEPAPVVIERVQATARHALDEAWLAGQRCAASWPARRAMAPGSAGGRGGSPGLLWRRRPWSSSAWA